MLRQVLQAMFTGAVHSRADLARRLSVSEPMLAQLMEDLARRGYLAPLTPPSGCGSCSGCPLRKVCNSNTSSQATAPKGWALTAKGREFAKNEI